MDMSATGDKSMWNNSVTLNFGKRDVVAAWIVCLALAAAFFGFPAMMTVLDN
jgi:hypothetical protein